MAKRPQPEVKDEDDSLIVTVRLGSGRFESRIEVPLHCTKEERERFVDSWFDLMVAGLKVGSERRALKEAAEEQSADHPDAREN